MKIKSIFIIVFASVLFFGCDNELDIIQQDNITPDNLFNTEWYGWCDIGYFRGRNDIDLSPGLIPCWPNEEKIKLLIPFSICALKVLTKEYKLFL